jgi:hypothetical protein
VHCKSPRDFRRAARRNLHSRACLETGDTFEIAGEIRIRTDNGQLSVAVRKESTRCVTATCQVVDIDRGKRHAWMSGSRDHRAARVSAEPFLHFGRRAIEDPAGRIDPGGEFLESLRGPASISGRQLS